jgi:hypothetical protein
LCRFLWQCDIQKFNEMKQERAKSGHRETLDLKNNSGWCQWVLDEPSLLLCLLILSIVASERLVMVPVQEGYLLQKILIAIFAGTATSMPLTICTKLLSTAYNTHGDTPVTHDNAKRKNNQWSKSPIDIDMRKLKTKHSLSSRIILWVVITPPQ